MLPKSIEEIMYQQKHVLSIAKLAVSGTIEFSANNVNPEKNIALSCFPHFSHNSLAILGKNRVVRKNIEFSGQI